MELTQRAASDMADDIFGIPDEIERIRAEAEALLMFGENEGPQPTADQREKMIRFLRDIGLTAVLTANRLETIS